mmetsp:Transcript_33660/g.107243  ORF Transcript_33660/g.107243 Transcript_33660/m.107243 type:complete len:231 (+) Transcript_33660:2379-3071(+)
MGPRCRSRPSSPRTTGCRTVGSRTVRPSRPPTRHHPPASATPRCHAVALPTGRRRRPSRSRSSCSVPRALSRRSAPQGYCSKPSARSPPRRLRHSTPCVPPGPLWSSRCRSLRRPSPSERVDPPSPGRRLSAATTQTDPRWRPRRERWRCSWRPLSPGSPLGQAAARMGATARTSLRSRRVPRAPRAAYVPSRAFSPQSAARRAVMRPARTTLRRRALERKLTARRARRA